MVIGKLECLVVDWVLENYKFFKKIVELIKGKIVVVGFGFFGLIVVGDLLKLGYEVIIFEVFYEVGGVLIYGIFEFWLLKKIVK